MDMKGLSLALLVIGCNEAEIANAFQAAGVWNLSEGPFPPFMSYGQYAEKIEPQIRSALAREHEVPAQPPFIEAWLAFALFEGQSALNLEAVIEAADSINHLIPNPDEIAWAFLQLGGRGWLVVEGDQYSLTADARRAIDAIRCGAWAWEGAKRLEEWILSHPPDRKR